MKKLLLSAMILMVTAGAVFAGNLIKQVSFDSTRGLKKWPAQATMELDKETKHTGKSSIVFTPDNHYVAYFYQKMQAKRQYTVSFWYMLDKMPIKRCGIAFNFNKKGGGNGSAGEKFFSMSEFAEADGQWHQYTGTFTTPAETAMAQVKLTFYRTNAIVYIDDFKIYEGEATASATDSKSSETTTSASTTSTSSVEPFPKNSGQLIKSVSFETSRGLTKWPQANTVELEKDDNGRASVVFSPDNNYCLYFYLRLKPAKSYTAEFYWKANLKPYKRCGFSLFFTSKGGKRGDQGKKDISLAALGECNDQWQRGTFQFTFPKNASTCQFMLNFYRSNAVIQISDLKIYETSSDSTQKKN